VKSLRLFACLPLCAACSSSPPKETPPLFDLDEPLAWMEEPDDEAERLELDPGGFTGIHVADARTSLDALVGESEGLLVTAVVENSPAQVADIVEGDVLLAVRVGGGEELLLEWPSQWIELEQDTPVGTELALALDRAGRELERTLAVVPRLVARERQPAARLREEARVGVVVRAATEVEARAAGMAPGSGAVVVGLARSSPWRAAGLVYGDLIAAVDGEPVAHPQIVLDAIRAAEADGELTLEVLRGEQRAEVQVGVTRRVRETSHVRIPPIYSYERKPRSSETSVLLGLLRVRRTEAAWDCRVLWLLSFGGGDADRLERID
jgi:C-terminal processing protease CtpA/Prc